MPLRAWRLLDGVGGAGRPMLGVCRDRRPAGRWRRGERAEGAQDDPAGGEDPQREGCGGGQQGVDDDGGHGRQLKPRRNSLGGGGGAPLIGKTSGR